MVNKVEKYCIYLNESKRRQIDEVIILSFDQTTSLRVCPLVHRVVGRRHFTMSVSNYM